MKKKSTLLCKKGQGGGRGRSGKLSELSLKKKGAPGSGMDFYLDIIKVFA